MAGDELNPLLVLSEHESSDETFDRIGHEVLVDSDSEESTYSEWDNNTLFGNAVKYPSANIISNFHDPEKFNRPLLKANLFIPDEYEIVPPNVSQKIYDWIDHEGHYGTGVSIAAFTCGLRLPFHPFVEKVLDHFGIGLGQLMPNSFLHINVFIAKCKALKIPRNLNVFLHFFQLVTNSKYSGFYSIGRRPKTPEWVITHTSLRGHHRLWFFIVGPGIVKYPQWRFPNLENLLPQLSTRETWMHNALTHDSGVTLHFSDLVKEKWLWKNHISCRGMASEAYQEQLRVKKQLAIDMRLAKKLNKKMKKKSPEIVTESGIERHDSSVKEASKDEDGHRTNAGTSKRNPKRTRGVSPPLPIDADPTILTAGLSSLALGQKTCSSLLLSPIDRVPMVGKNSTYCGKQVVAMLTQALSWSDAQCKASKAEATQLGDAADLAEGRATDMQLKWTTSEEQLKESQRQLYDRTKALSDVEEKLAAADKQILDAETACYERGLNERMQWVAEAGLDYTKVLQDFENDVWFDTYHGVTGSVPEFYIKHPELKPNYDSSPEEDTEGSDANETPK